MTDDATTRTFLIADIRGYTTYTVEHGDERAAELASRFATIVREVVPTHDGTLLELRGDEALVVFASARRALRASVELQARFASEGLPRGVGIGLDAGEAIRIEGGYRGTALNLAARLCAEAGPGVVIASESVVHLASRIEGLDYVRPRILRLKGFDEPVRAVDVIATGSNSVPSRSSKRRDPPDRRIAAAAVVGLLAVVVVAVGLAGALGASTAGPSPSPGPLAASASKAPTTPPAPTELVAYDLVPAIIHVDPDTGAVSSVHHLERPAGFLRRDAEYYLIASATDPIVQIDPTTYQQLRSIASGVVTPQSYAISDGILWVSDFDTPRVVGIDIATSRKVKDIALPLSDAGGAANMTIAYGSLWVGSRLSRDVVRIDASSGDVIATIRVGAYGVVSDGDVVIAQAPGRLARIDPTSNLVLWTSDEVTNPAVFTAARVAGGFVWAIDDTRGTVTKLDPATGRTLKVLDVGLGALGSVAVGDTLWVAVGDAGRLIGVDMTTNVTRTLEIGHFIYDVTATDDDLLVTLDRTADELIGHLSGDTLTITTEAYPFNEPDPARNWSTEGRQAGQIMCASLLRHPDKPAPDGWALEPEVARSLPDVSPDGKTYTFQVQDGWKFSDGQDVTADTFRYSIERALDPALGQFTPGSFFLADLETISAEDDRLTIRLKQPAGDFLERLSLPYFCPVPIGTPAVPNLDPRPPLPGTGPYYMAERILAEVTIFKRNPNYHGDRPQPFDAIAFREGIETPQAVALVEAGTYDAVSASFTDAALDGQSQRAATWGPGSPAAIRGDQRWFGAPNFSQGVLRLNPHDPLLADPTVRRAISLALDRRAISAVLRGDTPSIDPIPPGIPGAPLGPSPVASPDVAAANALMAGRTGTLVWGVGECDRCSGFTDAIRSSLAQIGITLDVRVLTGDAGGPDDPKTEIDIIGAGLSTNFPDPVDRLRDLTGNDWIGAAALAEIERLRPISGQARIDGAGTLVQRLAEEGLVIPVGHGDNVLYLGDDIGCGFVQPALGPVDLVSLCRKP